MKCLINIEILIKKIINTNFTKFYKFSLIFFVKLYKLKLINNIIKELIIYIAKTIIFIKNYIKKLFYLIILLTKFNIILKIS